MAIVCVLLYFSVSHLSDNLKKKKTLKVDTLVVIAAWSGLTLDLQKHEGGT